MDNNDEVYMGDSQLKSKYYPRSPSPERVFELSGDHAFIGRKRPRGSDILDGEDARDGFEDLLPLPEPEWRYPDLAEYFSHFQMQPRDIIVICRSYARYMEQVSKIKVLTTDDLDCHEKL